MSEHLNWGGSIRKVWPQEADKFRDHIMRLGSDQRRLRFGSIVSDAFIESYAARISFLDTIIFASFIDGEIRAAGELRRLSTSWAPNAEAAFSVEHAFEDHGLASALMGHVIASARNRGVTHLWLSCLLENRRMQAIARKYGAVLKIDAGDVVGEIVPEHPDYLSQISEVVDDRMGFVLAMLDVSTRSRPAASREIA